MKPVLLAADHVTSPARTPWGGTRLARALKRGLVSGEQAIGESWELSNGPDFPSRLEGSGVTLAAFLAASPEGLGREAALGGTALLVKLLDTAEALSVQIHPGDGDPALGPGESGKPECWYVEHAEAGAGVWLGLREGVGRDEVADCLERGLDLSRLLSFVPVEVGDFLLVEPGTPHAIGAGLTLVEPQRVRPGKAGVTYRYWDWNRRYDAEGRRSEQGTARTLHVARAMAVTDWARPRGAAFLAQARKRAGRPDVGGPAKLEGLAGPGGLASPWLEVARLEGSGLLPLGPSDSLRSLTVLEGRAVVDGVEVARGRTAALPAGGEGWPLDAHGVHAIVSRAL